MATSSFDDPRATWGRHHRANAVNASRGRRRGAEGPPPSSGAPLRTLASMPRVPRVEPGTSGASGAHRAAEPRRRANSLARPLARPFPNEHTAGVRSQASRPRHGSAPEPYATVRFPVARPGERDWDDETDDWETTPYWSEEDGWSGEDEASEAARGYSVVPAPAGRARLSTRALLLRQAHNPWAQVRAVLCLLAIAYALGSSLLVAGEPKPPSFTWRTGASSGAVSVVALAVKPLTSLLHPEQYDSPAQFQLYGGAACSPSVLAEVLTAWGVSDATIGHMIDDLGSYLSPSAGLLDQQGFQVAVAKHHFRADISWHLTYNQVLYLTNVLGLPVIVNFRRDYGYYSYFAGGHFLVVTGGDQQGLNIVDSSEYFITHLTRDVFDGLWQWRGDGTAMTVVVVPESYQYTLPPI